MTHAKLSFKEAFEKLTEIVNKLENQEQDIESMTKLFTEGVKLKNHCDSILDNEKNKIKIIAKENNISLKDIGLED